MNPPETQQWMKEAAQVIVSRYNIPRQYVADSYTIATVDDLADLLAAHAPQQQPWIPVSERLPEWLQRVNIFSGVLGILVAWVNSRGEWWDGNGQYREGVVTHWMPLPAPPNPEPPPQPVDNLEECEHQHPRIYCVVCNKRPAPPVPATPCARADGLTEWDFDIPRDNRFVDWPDSPAAPSVPPGEEKKS